MSTQLYACTLEVRWRDMDAYNHVNNQSYIGYIEEARVRWFHALDPAWETAAIKPILAAVTANYRQAITWPENVRIELFVERIGTKSLTVGHRVLSASDPSRLYCDGHAVLVWVDAQNQTVALPDSVRSVCTQD